jgi:uncharacterized damage-inducible protein DinB
MRLKDIAAERAPIIAIVIQKICQSVGKPFAAKTAPKKANGSANKVCSNLIISSVVFNFCQKEDIFNSESKTNANVKSLTKSGFQSILRLAKRKIRLPDNAICFFAFINFLLQSDAPVFFRQKQMQSNQILETWQINNRVNLYLLEAIAPENLSATLSSKGRNVGEQFAHIHNVRLMWLKQAAPELLENLNKIEKENARDKELLKNGLAGSGETIGQMLLAAIEKDGKIKGFKPHATAFLVYLISHEAHHRSQAILALKQSGHPVDKKILFGIWEWGVR